MDFAVKLLICALIVVSELMTKARTDDDIVQALVSVNRPTTLHMRNSTKSDVGVLKEQADRIFTAQFATAVTQKKMS